MAISTGIEQQLLVSVVVVTYNSSKYVEETLESIKNQTYPNIELIVTDDCSTDSTVDIVMNWEEKNKNRFRRVEIVTSPKNTGIAPNCNRGLKRSRGDWVKLIAGDDQLLPECISSNVDFSKKNKEAKVFFSRMQIQKNGEILKSSYPLDWQLEFFRYTAEKQAKLLLEKNYVWLAPAVFISRIINDAPVRFDEKYPFCEDHPLWLKLTRSGIKLNYFEKSTVIYRTEISATRPAELWCNPKYHESVKTFYFSERFRNINSKKLKAKHLLHLLLWEILIHVFKNKRSKLAKKFVSAFNFLLNPTPP